MGAEFIPFEFDTTIRDVIAAPVANGSGVDAVGISVSIIELPPGAPAVGKHITVTISSPETSAIVCLSMAQAELLEDQLEEAVRDLVASTSPARG